MKPPSTEITDNKRLILAGLLAALAAMTVASQAASSSTATGKRPNIVINLRLWN
jgi:ABC-type xylose transport system permease subunit